MISIITLLIVLTLSILVTRVATVALTHTGLARESAKFQARSAFTGVGFTTRESEKVVSHPVRRRILLTLMLLGNAGIVTAVSSLIVSFVNLNRSDSLIWQIVLLITGLIALWSLANSNWVDQHLSNLISRLLKRHTNLSIQDFSKLLHLAGDYQISELQVREQDWLAEKSISELGLRKEGVIVLGINRLDGNYLGAPDGETRINEGDVLLIYGRANVIEQLDKRSSDPAGDREHRETVISSTDGEARIVQGIITGIGFIGGGAIVKDEDKVAGTASAASIWNTGAIGLAVAFDRIEIAVLLSGLNFFSLFVFGKVKKQRRSQASDNN